jgi:hypothetical protein
MSHQFNQFTSNQELVYMKCSDFHARNQKPIDQMKADADLGSGEKNCLLLWGVP